MITWIGQWMREIIVILLFAAFVDLLLPNSSMQRYVKVVISLFILMTLLNPITTLFKMDIQSLQLTDSAIEAVSMLSLQDIMKGGESLKVFNDQHSLQFLENQISELIKADLDLLLPGKVKQVTTQVVLKGSNEAIEIKRVNVTLFNQSESLQSLEKSGDIAVIAPIKLILPIEFGEDEMDSEKNEELSRLSLKIKNVVVENWKIDSQLIFISIQE